MSDWLAACLSVCMCNHAIRFDDKQIFNVHLIARQTEGKLPARRNEWTDRDYLSFLSIVIYLTEQIKKNTKDKRMKWLVTVCSMFCQSIRTRAASKTACQVARRWTGCWPYDLHFQSSITTKRIYLSIQWLCNGTLNRYLNLLHHSTLHTSQRSKDEQIDSIGTNDIGNWIENCEDGWSKSTQRDRCRFCSMKIPSKFIGVKNCLPS